MTTGSSSGGRSGRTRRPDPTALLRSRARVFGARGVALLGQDRRPSLVGNIVGLTMAIVGAGVFVSGVVDAVDGGPDALVLIATGFVVWVIGSMPDPSGFMTNKPRDGGAWYSSKVPIRVETNIMRPSGSSAGSISKNGPSVNCSGSPPSAATR